MWFFCFMFCISPVCIWVVYVKRYLWTYERKQDKFSLKLLQGVKILTIVANDRCGSFCWEPQFVLFWQELFYYMDIDACFGLMYILTPQQMDWCMIHGWSMESHCTAQNNPLGPTFGPHFDTFFPGELPLYPIWHLSGDISKFWA